jgi:hypothetical protein
VEKLLLLVSVQRIVCSVQVQHDRLLGLFEILGEQVHEQICNPIGLGRNLVVSVRLPKGLWRMLKPPEGRFAGQRRPLVGLLGPIFSSRVLLACERRPGWILSKLVVVVQVFVSLNQSHDPLGKKLTDFVLTAARDLGSR